MPNHLSAISTSIDDECFSPLASRILYNQPVRHLFQTYSLRRVYIVAQLRLSKTTTPPLSSLPSPPIPTQPSPPRGGSPHCWILWTKLRWDLRYHPLEGRDPIHGQVFATASTGIIIIRGIVGGRGGREDLSRENLLLVYYYYARRCVVPFLIRSFATRMRWFRIETIIYIYIYSELYEKSRKIFLRANGARMHGGGRKLEKFVKRD